MASFFEEIWNSIFTPGTTPTLLLATNVSFGALQVVLFGMFLATYSIHFAALSAICGALWLAINWFVTELSKEQAKESAKEAEESAKRAQDAVRGIHNADDSDSTEVEDFDIKTRSPVTPITASKEVEVLEPVGELKHRAEISPGYKSGVSTEDEWEKVSENESEKDK